MPTKPPMAADLTWTGDFRFSARCGSTTVTLDGQSLVGPSPMQALACALAGCMSIDLVDILTKGRHPPRALRAHLVGQRAQDPPHRFVAVDLRFTIEGDVPTAAIERAIDLSRGKYCSVWQSLRQDIDFKVSFDVTG